MMLFESRLYDSPEWEILSKSARSVLVNLIHRADNDGKCHPSADRIAKDIPMTRNSVFAGIRELEKMGCIVSEYTGRSNNYTLAQWIMKSGKDQSVGDLATSIKNDTSGISKPIRQEYQKQYSNRVMDKTEIDHSQFSDAPLCIETETAPKKRSEKPAKPTVFSFSEFWEVYGKKEGKVKAEKAYRRIGEKDREKIKTTLKGFTDKYSDLQYRPHPTTYLNGKRWDDELEVSNSSIQGYKPSVGWL